MTLVERSIDIIPVSPGMPPVEPGRVDSLSMHDPLDSDVILEGYRGLVADYSLAPELRDTDLDRIRREIGDWLTGPDSFDSAKIRPLDALANHVRREYIGQVWNSEADAAYAAIEYAKAFEDEQTLGWRPEDAKPELGPDSLRLMRYVPRHMWVKFDSDLPKSLTPVDMIAQQSNPEVLKARGGITHTLRKKVRNFISDLCLAAVLDARSLLSFEAGPLDEADKLEARRWVAGVYIKKGYATPEDVKDGVLSEDLDPYQARSEYHGVKSDGKLLIAARLIKAEAGDPNTLQIHFTPEQLQRVAEFGAVVTELAALIKRPNMGPLGRLKGRLVFPFLLKDMIQASLDQGIDGMVFAMNPHLGEHFERAFGNAMERLGNPVEAAQYNGKFQPYLVDLRMAVQDIRTSTAGTIAGPALRRFFGSIRLPSDAATHKSVSTYPLNQPALD